MPSCRGRTATPTGRKPVRAVRSQWCPGRCRAGGLVDRAGAVAGAVACDARVRRRVARARGGLTWAVNVTAWPTEPEALDSVSTVRVGIAPTVSLRAAESLGAFAASPA